MKSMAFLSRLLRHVEPAAKTVLCTLAMLGLLAATAPAQIRGRQTFHIPFGFVVGKTRCPAGTYTVRVMSPGVLQISSAGGSKSVMFLARTETGKATGDRASLLFHRYGDTRYLNQIRPSNETSFLQLARSHDEEEVAKAWVEQQETVVASATTGK